MKRMVFSLKVERTPYQGRYFYIGTPRWAWKVASGRVSSAAHLRVERGDGESTRDLQIFPVAYHPGNTFWRAGCPAFTI
jgi:hypothetical protein